MIKKKIADSPIFDFQAVSVADVKEIIMKLKTECPMYKPKNSFAKANYRPVSVLPLISKVYKRLMFDRLSHHTKYFLN